MHARGVRNSNQILHGDRKIYQRNISTGSTTPPALAENSVTRMLTRDLFAVANLRVSVCYLRVPYLLLLIITMMMMMMMMMMDGATGQ